MKRFLLLFFVYYLVALIFLPMVVTWFVESKYDVVTELETEELYLEEELS
ncbi:MAG: hypothetical protein R3Y53_03525 [Bacillota bacterium]